MTCGANDPCPSGTTCGRDFHCHPPGDDTTCTFSVELELAGDQSLLMETRLVGVDTPLSCPGNCRVELAGGTELVLESVLGPMSNALFTFEGACAEHACRFSTLDRDVVVTAIVSEGKRIDAALAGDGQGTIVSEPEGISCPERCAAVFAPDQLVELTATESSPSKFRGWNVGDCDDVATCEIPPMDRMGLLIEATFDVNKLVLTPFGENTVGDKIEVFADGETMPRATCESPCEVTFDPDVTTAIQLQAVLVDEDSHKFQQWLGLSECTTDKQCSFDLGAETDRVGIAVFERRPLIRIDYGPSGSISIEPTPPATPPLNEVCKPAGLGPLASLTTCLFHVDLQTQLSVKAFASGHSTQWTGCPTLPAPPDTCDFTATTDLDLEATFILIAPPG